MPRLHPRTVCCDRLFNCALCDYGDNSRGAVETHFSEQHPNKRCRIVNQDKCLKHVQQLDTCNDDGTEVLGELRVVYKTSVLAQPLHPFKLQVAFIR